MELVNFNSHFIIPECEEYTSPFPTRPSDLDYEVPHEKMSHMEINQLIVYQHKRPHQPFSVHIVKCSLCLVLLQSVSTSYSSNVNSNREL